MRLQVLATPASACLCTCSVRYEQGQELRRTSNPEDLNELRAQQVAVAASHEAAVVEAVLAIVGPDAVCALHSCTKCAEPTLYGQQA